jgi:uncharacterized protein
MTPLPINEAPLTGRSGPDIATLALGDAGLLRPGPLRWLRALAWMVALLVILVAILSLQSVVRSIDPDPSIVLAMAFVCTIVAYCAYAGLVRAVERRPAHEIALRYLVPEVGAGWLIGVAAMSAIVTPSHWTDWPHDVRETFGTGFLEELLARAVIFRLLARAFGITPALLLSAVAFGAAHLGNTHGSIYSAVAIAVEAGLSFAAFYLLTGRIWMSVGIHAGWNLAQGGIFGARVSGFDSDGSLLQSLPAANGHNWLNGGAFGPEGSAPAILIGLALFLAVMAVRRTRLNREMR